MAKAKHIGPRALAGILCFTVIGKLRRLPDTRYGITGHDPCWIDEAGNEYQCGLLHDVCPGVIVTAEGEVI